MAYPPSSKLVSLIWNITNRCNSKCKYCATNSSIQSSIGPSKKEWMHVVNLINNSDVRNVAITGGEPLLRKDLPLILNKLNNSVAVHLDTNGILLKTRWNNVFRKLHHISISVDSTDAIIHNKLRGNYNIVIENLKWAISKGLKVGVTITVTDNNVDNLEKTIRDLVSFGVSIIGLNRLQYMGRNYNKSYTNNAISGRNIRKYEKLAESLGVKVRVAGWYDNYFEEGASINRLPSCFCGVYKASIRYDGSMLPCQFLTFQEQFDITRKYYSIPSVYSFNNLDDVLTTDIFRDFSKATCRILPEGCEDCSFNKKCDHGCRAESWLAGLGLSGNNILCEYSYQSQKYAKPQELKK